jgi:hypothetical protein
MSEKKEDNWTEWTTEQEEVIGKMIKESESIGYTQGYDDRIKEEIAERETEIFELKKKVFIKQKEKE